MWEPGGRWRAALQRCELLLCPAAVRRERGGGGARARRVVSRRRAEKALEQTCKVSGCMFSSGCCGCPYGEQSAGRGGGRRNDQEGGLVGSEQLAAVRHPAGLLWTV